jgi:hypothetical protein
MLQDANSPTSTTKVAVGVGDAVSSTTNVGLCVVEGPAEGLLDGVCVCPVNVGVAVTIGAADGETVGALWHSQGSRTNAVRTVQNWGAINPS